MKIKLVVLLYTMLFLYTGISQEPSPPEIKDSILLKESLYNSFEEIKNFFYKSDYAKVIEYTPRYIEEADAIEFDSISSRFRSLLGGAFIELGEFDKADKIYSTVLAKAKRENDTTAILSSYINLGNVYINSNPVKSIVYLEEGLRLFMIQQKHQESNFISFILHNNLSELYIGTEQVEKASFHSNKALSILTNSDIGAREDEGFAVIYFVQGSIALLQDDYEGAIEKSNKALEIGLNVVEDNYLLEIYENLITAYDKTGRLKKLNEIRKLYDPLKDKRYEAEKIRQQQIVATRYKIEAYEQELRESELKNELTYSKATRNKILFVASSIIVVFLALLVTVLFLSRKKKIRLLESLKTKNKEISIAREKSEKIAESKTALLSTISHELRTPLYGIIGLTSVFLEDEELKNQKEDLVSLKFSADYLLALVNDVLHLNKLSSDKGRELTSVTFNLKEVVQSIIKSFAFINAKNNNKVVIDIDDDVPEKIVNDKTKISQILMNLVSNASKFTEDGTIGIHVKSGTNNDRDKVLHFSVADTGMGIPKDQQKKIFEEFAQVNTLEDKGGTGLGLSIVSKILDLLGSKLLFKSTYGEGTTFSFDLKYTLPEENRTDKTTMIMDREVLRDKFVLIVDDNRINQVVTRKVLETFGMRHHTVSNGQEAVEAAQEHNFDIILMDINMPVMDGKQASRTIRDLNNNVPIIALSATDYVDISTELSSFGIDDHITKPYDNEMLLEMLIKYV